MKLLYFKLCNYFTTLTLHHVEVVSLLPIPLAERWTGRGPSPSNQGDFLCFEAASWIASHLLKSPDWAQISASTWEKKQCFSPWLDPSVQEEPQYCSSHYVKNFSNLRGLTKVDNPKKASSTFIQSPHI